MVYFCTMYMGFWPRIVEFIRIVVIRISIVRDPGQVKITTNYCTISSCNFIMKSCTYILVIFVSCLFTFENVLAINDSCLFTFENVLVHMVNYYYENIYIIIASLQCPVFTRIVISPKISHFSKKLLHKNAIKQTGGSFFKLCDTRVRIFCQKCGDFEKCWVAIFDNM